MTRLAALIACLALAPSAAPAGCPAGGCPTGTSSYRVERTYATAYVAPTPAYAYSERSYTEKSYGPAPQAYAPAYAGKAKTIAVVKERRGFGLFGRRRGR